MTIGIRDLSRNTKIFEDYDYFDIEDKKTHKYKGIFVSEKYALDVKKLIEGKIAQEKLKEVDEIMRFAGSTSVSEEYINMTSKEIRSNVVFKKYE